MKRTTSKRTKGGFKSDVRHQRNSSIGGKWIRQDKRLAIYIRDGFKCASCDRDLRSFPAAEVQLDHIVPRSKGGTNHQSNLTTCCRSCNSSRGNKAAVKFYGSAKLAEIRKIAARKLNMDLARSFMTERNAA